MTNQAEKKRALEAKYKCTLFAYAAWFVTLWYLLYRVLYHWESMSIWLLLGFALAITLEAVSYHSIKSSILEGLDYETMLDLLGLTLGVLLLGSFSDWAWVLYLILPGILCYKCGGLLLSWADRSGKATEEETEEGVGRNRRERRQAKAHK